MKNAIGKEFKDEKREVDNTYEIWLPEEQEKTYKIYEYIKRNPGVFAGSGAVIITAFSALLKFCSFLCECSILKYWNIDPVYINLDNASRLYGTIAAFIFVSVTFVYIFGIDMLVEKNLPVRRKVLYLKRIKWEYRKEVFKKNLYKIWSWCLRRNYDRALDNHSTNAKGSIAQLEESLKQQRRLLNKEIIRHLFLFDFILSLSVWIWICTEMSAYSESILMLLVASGLVSTMLTAAIYLISRDAFVDKKKIKDEAVRQYEVLEIETDVPQITFPLKRILSGNYSIKQSDRQIKRLIAGGLVLLLFVVASLFVVFQVFGYYKAVDQDQFMITDVDGVQYAMIYNNGDYAIIAPCRESEKILTIDASFQIAVSIEGLEYEIRDYWQVKQGPITTD